MNLKLNPTPSLVSVCAMEPMSVYIVAFAPLLHPQKARHLLTHWRANSSLAYTAPNSSFSLHQVSAAYFMHATLVSAIFSIKRLGQQMCGQRESQFCTLWSDLYYFFHSWALALQTNYAVYCICTFSQVLCFRTALIPPLRPPHTFMSFI